MACPGYGSLKSVLNGDVWRYLPLPPIPTLVVAIVGLSLLVVASLRHDRTGRLLAAALLVATVMSILAVTLGGQSLGIGRTVNLHPGAGIRAELDNVNRWLGIVNVLGNLVMFVPLGWLVAVRALYSSATRVRQGIFRGVVVGVALSLAIEVSQYLLGRSADIDDVLLNTMGCALGAVMGASLSEVRRRRTGVEPDPERMVARR